MLIFAEVSNQSGSHQARVATGDRWRDLAIPPRESGSGSAVNGGELLFLALATCYCNDLYREAEKRGIRIRRVAVAVQGEFGGVGEPAREITYRAEVDADATDEEIRALIEHTDRVAEIQNTLRAGVPVTLLS